MKAIRILMVVLFSFFGFAATAQTYRIHKTDGSVVEYATTDVDSIVFIDAPTTIYYGTGSTIPTTEAEIKQGTPYTTTSSSAILPSIACSSIKACWVAVPNDWHLVEWKDNLGTDIASQFTATAEITAGRHYQTIGDYILYYRLAIAQFNQTYTIKVSK